MKGHQTRSARSRREFWKRTGIWIFIFVFAFSVVGGLIAVVASFFASPR
jgi:ABC-type Fe3+ transport system permease subunit